MEVRIVVSMVVRMEALMVLVKHGGKVDITLTAPIPLAVQLSPVHV